MVAVPCLKLIGCHANIGFNSWGGLVGCDSSLIHHIVGPTLALLGARVVSSTVTGGVSEFFFHDFGIVC